MPFLLGGETGHHSSQAQEGQVARFCKLGGGSITKKHHIHTQDTQETAHS